MWGLENAYRDRTPLLTKGLQEKLEAQLDALRKQIDALSVASKRS